MGQVLRDIHTVHPQLHLDGTEKQLFGMADTVQTAARVRSRPQVVSAGLLKLAHDQTGAHYNNALQIETPAC